MRIDDFDYHLPIEVIAQYPLKKRDKAKLLVLQNGNVEHKLFCDLPQILNRGDLLVFNDSMVIKARLRGEKETGGKIELLLVNQQDKNIWQCLGRGRLKEGTTLYFYKTKAKIIERKENKYLVEFDANPELLGETPLPPYIKRPVDPSDNIYYQNIFARVKGSVAAPTAGLHFTEELLKQLNCVGVEHAMITCHIRPGIFQKVKEINDFNMEPEPVKISADTVQKIKRAKRLIAVGTSVVRTLENFGSQDITPGVGKTDIFISPGFQFSKISGMITNFHLPKSPPFIMVSSFVGLDKLKNTYKIAIKNGYRFLSYGDGMLII